MKASDFNLKTELKFDFEQGFTSFRNTRLLIFDANAIGLLRNLIIQQIGLERAKELFLKFGYQHGFADFIQMKISYQFDSEMDLLASGPTIHTWEGLVQATPKEIRFNRDTGDFYFSGVWTNSYEAQQHLQYNRTYTEPICWSLMGYASGWCTAFFGKPLIAIEPLCMGKGDNHCEWLIQPPEKWGHEAKPFVNAFNEYWKVL